MAPPRGLSTPRALKVKKERKSIGQEIKVVLQIRTMFCMREAVTISYGSRIIPSPLGL